jgi:hypothetical protein
MREKIQHPYKLVDWNKQEGLSLEICTKKTPKKLGVFFVILLIYL